MLLQAHEGMYPDFFHYLECHLTPGLQKQDTDWRRALPVGLDFSEMHNAWRVGFSTAGKVIIKFCEPIMFKDNWKKDGACLIALVHWMASTARSASHHILKACSGG